MFWLVYIVRCTDGTLYTGMTNDLEKRLKLHNTRRGAKYTKGRAPVELLWYKSYATKSEALREEYRIKKLSLAQKNLMIHQDKNRVFAGGTGI